MKFEYDDEQDRREVVAELYEFGGGPELCLAVKGKSGDVVWIYPDGVIINDGPGFADDPIKKFYRGDKITITF